MIRILLLYPLAILFDIVTGIRNRLYDRAYKPSASFEIPLIGVGNLTVGGTGKTPMIEHLLRLLKPTFKVATLSRGYGRRTKGIRIASAEDDATTLGDEPYQFYRKFRKVPVVVGEERVLAIPYLVDRHPDTQVVLLDDVYQHRKVKPAFLILLTDYNRPFYSDFLLPAGNLRESRFGARRANVVVVTKCPIELDEEEMMEIESKIRKYTPGPVFFASIRYGNLISFGDTRQTAAEQVILVSGIANAKPLEAYVKQNYTLVKHIAFADHHHYKRQDMEILVSLAQAHQAAIVTTEKDAVKMDIADFAVFLSRIPFFYLPIELEFLKNGKEFDEMVLNVVKHG